MIGWYVHHHGHGHLHRALAVAARLVERGEEVTLLSSLPRPAGWDGGWVDLARDDDGPAYGAGDDPTAHGRLHWVPLGDAGLCARTATVSAWVAREHPRLVVVDVSVEVAALVRLHGVPVVSVVLPGRRDDPAHLLGLGLSHLLVAAWPPEAGAMLPGLPAELALRVRPVGGLSRFPVRAAAARRPGPRRVVVLMGSGGHGLTDVLLDRAREQTPGWEWTVLDGRHGTWTDDPSALVADADVVVTHAGQNALAEVAAARRPAVVVPQQRPHDEQVTTGAELRRGPWPAVVVDELPQIGWPALLDRAAALDGAGWAAWCDGHAADRFADLLLDPAPVPGRGA